jgi:fumarate reductase flavoprotein subunit
MSELLSSSGVNFTLDVPVLIIGAGACGLTAALAARDGGADVLVLERDASPSGSTALSSGLIPAAPTRFQSGDDSADQFAADIQAKARGTADAGLVATVTQASGPTLEWLADHHGLQWTVLREFLYPGHSHHRMHAVPERTGASLMARLLAAANAANVTIAPSSRVTALYGSDDGTVAGVRVTRPDGRTENISCRQLILACNGYGGNADLVHRHIPEMADALYFGHAGNQGDAVLWGEKLGAGIADLGAYQGHGSVAHPHGVLITWALMMEGGIQVNLEGRRFSNEHLGYSEQSVAVLSQPEALAWCLYDRRLHELGSMSPDYGDASGMKAVVSGQDAGELAGKTGLPADALRETLQSIERYASGLEDDPFGRDFTAKPALVPPFHAVRVTGALFHTQGGLIVDGQARVLKADGTPFLNLYAGGGAARGVSGEAVWGYLSGNGLLTATTLGRIAGNAAAGVLADS